jgi:uncharacterized protein YdbL (DUF1318 family)
MQIYGGLTMKSLLILAALTLAVSPAMAADTIGPSKAMTRQGEAVLVEGTAHVSEGANGDLRFVLTDSGTGHLVIDVPSGTRAKLPDLASYDGKTLDIMGTVEYGDRGAEIKINRANQIKIASP